MSTFSEAALYRGWLPPASRHLLGALLTENLPWEQKQIVMFGREMLVPRLTCWTGGKPYTYSGVVNQPHPWPAWLVEVRDAASATCGTKFNSCLANMYRDGKDSVSWHSDDEPGLGDKPVIATLSLGATRTFSMRHRKTKQTISNELHAGDLLVMYGDSQKAWEHAVLKEPAVHTPRVSLTFRKFG